MGRYVALLRGINVGGKNIISMKDLRACFEAMAFTGVVTYIQSGNVLFTSSEKSSALVARIEADLAKEFAYNATIVLRSRQQLHRVVHEAPAGFGARPDTYRYDVIFLKEPLSAGKVMGSIAPKEGVDGVFAGRGVVYFSRLIRKATQSRLSRIVSLPIYKQMTIRNWNTTSELLALVEAPV